MGPIWIKVIIIIGRNHATLHDTVNCLKHKIRVLFKSAKQDPTYLQCRIDSSLMKSKGGIHVDKTLMMIPVKSEYMLVSRGRYSLHMCLLFFHLK